MNIDDDTHDVFGSPPHSGASRRHGSPRCKGVLQCKTALLLSLGEETSVKMRTIQKHSLSDPLYGLLTVPAGPVARAGSLVAEDAIEPVAVLSALWRIWGRCK